jgi:hypothetical protein
MGRHFKGPEFHQPQSRRSIVARVQFIDADFSAVSVASEIGQEVAEDAVDSPWTYALAKARVRNLIEGDLQFVERVSSSFIYPRMLAGRPDEESRKEIGKRRVILPEADQTAQQIGTPQECAVFRSEASDNYVIAAPGAGRAAIEEKFLGSQARLAGQVVEFGGIFHKFLP